MKGRIVATLVLTAILSISLPASAADYLTTVSNGLNHSSVYIAPGTEDTDANTASNFKQNVLYPSDNIMLVMLPTAAKAGVGNIAMFARQLSAKIGKRHIIGLAVGDQTYGYGSTMPSGLAENDMSLAASASSDSIDTLTIFVQNVHNWQSEHPAAKITKQMSQDNSMAWWLKLLIALGCGALCFSAAFFLVNRRLQGDRSNQSRTHFKAPNDVSDLLNGIAELRKQVRDTDLRDTLYQVCTDIERYFQKYSSDKRRDGKTFKQHLTSVRNVLQKYVDIQDNPRDFNDSEAKLLDGKTSIEDFAKYVIKTIRSGNDVRLIDYKVDTNILQAQSFR